MIPVIFQPNHAYIGKASTENGAKRHARNIPIWPGWELTVIYVKDYLVEPEDPNDPITFIPVWLVQPRMKTRKRA